MANNLVVRNKQAISSKRFHLVRGSASSVIHSSRVYNGYYSHSDKYKVARYRGTFGGSTVIDSTAERPFSMSERPHNLKMNRFQLAGFSSNIVGILISILIIVGLFRYLSGNDPLTMRNLFIRLSDFHHITIPMIDINGVKDFLNNSFIFNIFSMPMQLINFFLFFINCICSVISFLYDIIAILLLA